MKNTDAVAEKAAEQATSVWKQLVLPWKWYKEIWKAAYQYTKLGLLQGVEWTKVSAKYLNENWVNWANLQQATKVALTVYGYYLVLKWSWRILSGMSTFARSWRKNRKVSALSYESIYGSREVCLKDWVFISGASDGIGLEFARELYSAGFNMILGCSGKVENQSRVLGYVSDDHEADMILPKAVPLPLDLSTATVEEIYQALEKIMKLHHIEQIRLLVNNCGGVTQKPFVDQSLEEVLSSLNLNFKAHIACSTYFENKIQPQSPGQASGMILTSCLNAQRPMSGLGLFGYSKQQSEMFIQNISSKYDFCYSGLIVAPGNVLTKSNNPFATERGEPAEDYRKHTAWEAGFSFVTSQHIAQMSLRHFARAESRFEKVHGTFKHDVLGLLSGLYLRGISYQLKRKVANQRSLSQAQQGILQVAQIPLPIVKPAEDDYEFV